LIEDIKVRALKIADEILNNKDNGSEIKHYTDNIIQATRSADFNKIVEFDKSCYRLINSIDSESNSNPLNMSVMQFYQKLEDIKNRNNKIKT
jgi:thiaminase